MILVTGASGYVGRAAVRRLSAMGHPVAAMAQVRFVASAVLILFVRPTRPAREFCNKICQFRTLCG
jgi:nucleoside-diphosphate-sugar epimerase